MSSNEEKPSVQQVPQLRREVKEALLRERINRDPEASAMAKQQQEMIDHVRTLPNGGCVEPISGEKQVNFFLLTQTYPNYRELVEKFNRRISKLMLDLCVEHNQQDWIF